MDLESESSALESTGDNDLVCSANPSTGDDVKIELNGCSLHDDGYDGTSYGNGSPIPPLHSVEVKEDAIKLNSEEHDTAKLGSDNSGSIHSSGKGNETDQKFGNSSAVTKGKGLRRWRRIRRDVTRDNTLTETDMDGTKILKRGSENLESFSKVAYETKQKSEGSVSSTNAFVNNLVSTDSYSNDGSSSVYKVAGVSTFCAGADSDNGEDRSSKSSTAASIPKNRYDMSRGSGHSRKKHTGRKHIYNTPQTQKVQQGARQLDAGKKQKGEAFNMDKENSLSSLESDSRNYCSLFMQGSSSAMNNGHSERQVGSDGEHSDDEQTGDQESVEGRPTGGSGSVGEGEEISKVDAAVSWQIPETVKNYKVSGNEDPLLDCVQMLESVQETLNQEIQKFGKLGKEDLQLLNGDSIKATDLSVYSNSAIAELLGPVSNRPTSEDDFHTIELLENQLKEKTTILNEKESRIAELESLIEEMNSYNQNLGRTIDTQKKKLMDMESEMESLFIQKTEAEIKLVLIADKSYKLENQTKLLLAEQKSETPSKSVLLKDKDAAKGVSFSRVAKYTFCFFTQLILLGFVLAFFVSRFLPKTDLVMPT